MALTDTPRNKVLDEQIRTAIALVASQLSYKATAGTLARNVAFDPNAIDGDGDGMVQDGSPFERPAVIKAVLNASQRIATLLSRATKSKESRAREYQRRHSGMSAKDIARDVVPDSLEGWTALAYERMRIANPDLPSLSDDLTPSQRAEVVRALEDFVEDDLRWMLSPERASEFEELKKTDRAAAFRMLVDGAFDFSPKTVAKNRELVEHVLTTNPEFRALVDRFGMPSITSYGPNMDSGHTASAFYDPNLGMALGKYGRVRSQGRMDGMARGLKKWFMQGIVGNTVGSKRTNRWLVSNSPESLITHEYGHYLAHVIRDSLGYDEAYRKTARWRAFRFATGHDWKETFDDIGRPDFHDMYAIQSREARIPGITITKRLDPPDELPHVRTAYGESVPAEAWAEAISAIFSHGGRDSDLVSPGLRELINDGLELPAGGDPRESVMPARASRRVVPDGFASRGSTMVVNAERDSQFGDKGDAYELTAEMLGGLDDGGPVDRMLRALRNSKDTPSVWDKLNDVEKKRRLQQMNIRVANEKEAALVAQTLLDNPGLADLVRRHGIGQIYFSKEDLLSYRNDGTEIQTRGTAFDSYVPDEDADPLSPPRIVMDLVGQPDYRETLDAPSEQLPQNKLREWKTKKIPGNVTRSHVSLSDSAVLRHEMGHSMHDRLWERVHRGEIKGRRAALIRAYASVEWEQFYKELGRPDLWEEHQRSIRANYNLTGRLLPAATVPSRDIQQIDSAYAWSNPREFFAESFTAYTSSNPEMRALMNDTALSHMQEILGDADHAADLGAWPGNPEAIPDVDEADIPQPPPWDGFASKGPDGTSPKSYSDFRAERLKKAGKSEQFSRSDMFRNTTTDQKVDLAVPTNRRDYKLMLWDAYFEKMGLRYEEYRKIDLSDPDNPKPPRRWGSEFADDLLDVSRRLDVGMPDFNPATVEANRQAVRSALDAFPRMRELAERFGIPPVTTMTRDYQDRAAREFVIQGLLAEVTGGRKQMSPQQIQALFDAAAAGFDTIKGLDDPRYKFLRDVIDGFEKDGTMEKLRSAIAGGYSTTHRSINVAPDGLNSFIDGTRYDPAFVPEKGDFLVGGSSYEATLLHEFAHHVDMMSMERDEMLANAGDQDAIKRMEERARLTGGSLIDEAGNEATRAEHIATTYGQSSASEFFAESIAAVLSGSRDQEAMLSPDANKLARSIAGIPENDPVFAGRTIAPKYGEVTLVDRFGSRWNRTPEGEWSSVDKLGKRSHEGVPDVLETMVDAKRRTGLTAFDDVSFEHEGRRFVLRQEGDTFSVDVNGRTVAMASVVEGRDGLPEISNVDVSPGYEGVAPDKDLHEMVVDHARKKYPSARAPERARRTRIEQDGFASVGPEHHDARKVDGTPGTPEYAEALAAEFEAAKASGKRVLFDYNDTTRDVEVTEVVKRDNGFWYLVGNDAARGGEQREFRLDRVSMPKVVKNPETGAKEVAVKPGKKPRRPVPIFTGKAAELFEGAQSWEEVAERLGKGRFVFFDFETTGIVENPDSVDYVHPGSPTQIGLVEIIDGKVTRRWSTHVNPGRPLSVDPKTGRSWSADNLKYRDPVTGELTPVSDEWLAKQRPLKEALEEMLEFIGPIEDTILGGQNHPYDNDVMKRAMEDTGLDPARWSPGGFIDSQALAQSLLDVKSNDYPRDPEKGYKTVSLRPLAAFLGHDMGDGWHSADVDSEASWEAFSRLVRRAADHENSGKPVRRDLFEPGGGDRELAERIAGFEREKRGWDYKVKKYKEAQASQPPETPGEGFASRGPTGEPRVRARNPKSWDQMTSLEREEATRQSAENAIEFLDKLADQGFGPEDIRNLTREELVAFLADQFPERDVVLSDATALGGGHLIEVANATMGKVFMAMGFHVTVRDDDPTQLKILENGINDMQTALREYVDAIKKKPDELLKTGVFKQWVESQKKADGTPKFDLTSKKDLKKAAKAFRDQFEIDMCLYYKADINLLCGENIGIEREEMPQLSGRMTGDDSFAARAVRAGFIKFSKLKIDEEALSNLDEATQKRIRDLLAPTKANKDGKLTNQIIADIAKNPDHPDHDLVTKQLWGVVNWNDSEVDAGSLQDAAAQALGITVEEARFVDPATMLGAQNQLQGSKVENMADGATSTILETILTENGQAIPVLDESIMTDEWVARRFELEVDDKEGIAKARAKIAELRAIAADPAKYKTTENKILENMAKIIDLDAAAKWVKANPAAVTEQMMDRYHDHLANVRKNGLFGATLTAANPGTQIYMLDGHHRWSGLLTANQKLADLGLDVRVKLNIKNYQTDIRSGLELGKALQIAFGIKDAKVKGEDLYVKGDFPAMTQAEFDKVIADLKSKDFIEKAVDKIRKVKESPFRRKDTPGDKSGAVKPRKRPIQDVADEIAGRPVTLEPKSRVDGVKAQATGYRASDGFASRGGWNSVEDHIAIETDRGNPLFDAHKEYVDKGFEAAWVTHEPGEAGRYAASPRIPGLPRRPFDDVRLEDYGLDDADGIIERSRIDDVQAVIDAGWSADANDIKEARRKIDQIAQTNPKKAAALRKKLDRLVAEREKMVEEALSQPFDRPEPYLLRPEDVEEVDLAGATLVGTDGEGGFLYVRKKPTARSRRRVQELRDEEELLDGFASRGVRETVVSDEKTPRNEQNVEQREVRLSFEDSRGRKVTARVVSTIDYSNPDVPPRKDVNIWIADESGKNIGALFAKKGYPDPQGLNDPNDMTISDVTVDDDRQRSGLATAMMELASKYNVDGEEVKHSRYLSPTGKLFAEGVERKRRSGDGFASMGSNDPFESVALDVVAGAEVPETSVRRGGKAQRDREIVPDDYQTRLRDIAGARFIDRELDEFGIPMPGEPIYREDVRIGRKKYVFEVDASGVVSVYTGRRYKQVAQLTLDRGHTHIGGRRLDRDRHHIDGVSVDKRHRRKGIATEMLKVAEHVYGGRVEHSAALTKEGRKFRDADVERRGTPGAVPSKDPFDDYPDDGFASRYVPDNPDDPDDLDALDRADDEADEFTLREEFERDLEKRRGRQDGFASRGSTGDAFDSGPDSPLDRAADLLKLGRGAGTDSDLPDATMGRFGTMVTPKDQQTLARRLGLTWEQITEQWERNAGEINQFVDRFIADPEVREWVKYGLKFLSIAGSFAGATRGMAELLGKLEFNPGSGEQSGVQDVFDMIVHFVDSGIGEALLAYGTHYAQLIAAELAAMRLVTRQKAKKMVEEIQARIEGTGQYIGTMSREMWDRLRGAWAKTRPIAPVPSPAMAKEWIVSGTSPMWAELSLSDYRSKSRITDRLAPTDPARWMGIATKVGRSPELIDIAAYRSGTGYGPRRVKSRDVVRVYL